MTAVRTAAVSAIAVLSLQRNEDVFGRGLGGMSESRGEAGDGARFMPSAELEQGREEQGVGQAVGHAVFEREVVAHSVDEGGAAVGDHASR